MFCSFGATKTGPQGQNKRAQGNALRRVSGPSRSLLRRHAAPSPSREKAQSSSRCSAHRLERRSHCCCLRATPRWPGASTGGSWASPSVLTGTSTTLSVLGGQDSASDGGAANLYYWWGVTAMPRGAAYPTFSVNNSNSASTTTVTVHQAGTYTFVVTLLGYVSGSAVSTPSYVTVTVNQTLTSVAVSPGPIGLAAGQSQALTATARDQFGQQMAPQPAFTWSTTAGTVSTSGFFTAPSNGATATAGSVAGQTKVYPTSALPTVASPAAAGSGWVTGTSTTLSVLGADAAGAWARWPQRPRDLATFPKRCPGLACSAPSERRRPARRARAIEPRTPAGVGFSVVKRLRRRRAGLGGGAPNRSRGY